VNKSAGVPLFRPWIESLQAHLWLAQGNLFAAVDWGEHSPYPREALAYSREIAYLALARVFLAERRYPEALQLLAALLSSAEQVARVGSMIAILSLQVAVLQASGVTQEALRVLDRLLTQASPEGYLRVFLDAGEPMHAALQAWLKSSQNTASPALVSYAQTVLTAFACEQRQILQQKTILPVSKTLPAASSQTAQQLLEPLTPREREVLKWLSEGATNQEIANRLVVSLATVKKHVANILSKLGVENRTQAIARARALSLL
jgi:LuxR family transcriptional regulator, maltose regulon positive regulatory protein